jgi:type IV secretion system protein VirD4
MNTHYDKYNNAVRPQVRAPRAKGGWTIPALAALSALAGLQCATQFFAHEFQYQSGLGAHFQHLYAPWSNLHWASKWHGVYTESLLRAGSVGILPTGLGLTALDG